MEILVTSLAQPWTWTWNDYRLFSYDLDPFGNPQAQGGDITG